MKRLVVGALVLLAFATALELSVRGGSRTALLDPGELFEPARRGWCAGAWSETDSGGQRRGATAKIGRPHGRRVWVVGGPFTAGAGLEEDELYSARLEARVRAGGFEDVVAVATRSGKPDALLRLLPEVKRDDVVVIEIDGDDLGGDPKPFEIAAPARALPAIERSESAALTWTRLVRQRAERRRLEEEIAALVVRDGFTGRASARSKLRLESITKAMESRRPDAAQAALLRGWVAERFGMRCSETRNARLAEWRAALEEIRRSQKAGVLLVTGATATTLSLAQTSRDLALEVVHAAPFELDPDLRLDVPFARPSAAVHAQAADTLWVALSRRGLLAGPSAAPEAVVAAADAIEQQVLARGGTDEALIALAMHELDRDADFLQRAPPIHALFGVGANGRLEADNPAEIVLRRPSFPAELVVRAEVQAGALPRLGLRHFLGAASGDATRVGPGSQSNRALLEWRFAAPAARAPIEFTPIELTLRAGPDGTRPLPIELREIRFTQQPAQDRPDQDR